MTPAFQPPNLQRFNEAIHRFDEENSRDPNLQLVEGQPQPRELVYSRWLTEWVLRLCPSASEELRLASRCQHLCRWMVPRDSYPMTRAGYLKWRENLKHFHAEKAAEILRQTGYAPEIISRVQSLNLKQNFPNDPEGRVLEDALCLVFLERQLGELAGKTSADKMVNALQKAWTKMTPAARDFALQITYSPLEKSLLDRALAPPPGQTPASPAKSD